MEEGQKQWFIHCFLRLSGSQVMPGTEMSQIQALPPRSARSGRDTAMTTLHCWRTHRHSADSLTSHFFAGHSFRKSRYQAGVFQHFCCISWLLTLFASHLVFLELFTYLFFWIGITFPGINIQEVQTRRQRQVSLPLLPLATQTPSSRVFSSPPCVLLETVYAFIKQAGVYTSPWLFCTNQSLLYAWWSMIFVPHCLLEIGFRQSVPVLAAILYFFILFLQLHCVPLCGSDEWCYWFSTNGHLASRFSGLQALLLWTFSYICYFSHMWGSLQILNNLFLSTQLCIKWKQES